MPIVRTRASGAERMDDPGIPPAELRAALADLRRTNRWLGGVRALGRALHPYLATAPADRPLEILDVGTGGADLPIALVHLARGLGRSVSVTAVDLRPQTASFAAEAVAGTHGVRIVCADARRLPFGPRSFDLVVASLFLHHFDDGDVARLLDVFRRLARRAVVVNDLRRHAVPWAFIAVTARLLRRGPTYVHDAPLSVRRGFTADELQAAARASGARGARVRLSWPFRLVLEIDATGGA